MISDRSDRRARAPVTWSPSHRRPDGRVARQTATWLTPLAAAALVLVVFALALLILTASLVPGPA
jgi:hypothetical protein